MSRLGMKVISLHRYPINSVTARCSKSTYYQIPIDRFRMKIGLKDKLNKTRELQDYPDYSYVDGRPSPVTPGQLQKINRQRELTAAAVKHLKEIKFIEERFNNKVQAAQTERQQILNSKLKPKGDALLQRKDA